MNFDLSSLCREKEAKDISNADRIRVSSGLEILRTRGVSGDDADRLEETIKCERLQLQHRRNHSASLLCQLDDMLRLFGAALTLVVFSIVMVLPCALFVLVDHLFVERLRAVPSCFGLNLLVKRAIGSWLLLVMGVVLVVEDRRGILAAAPDCVHTVSNVTYSTASTTWFCGSGLQRWRSFWSQWYLNSRSFLSGGSDEAAEGGRSVTGLVCFSHGSSLDALVLCAAIPLPSYTYAKAEVFLIPFFGWMSALFGGIAVERGSQASAIRSLNSVSGSPGCGSAPSSRQGRLLHETLVCIAPEGTRSQSGQLLAFKKGPFHLWDSLRRPPITPLLIMGAFELMPPPQSRSPAHKGPAPAIAAHGSSPLMAQCGRVYVRLLPPVTLSRVLESAVSDGSSDNRLADGEKLRGCASSLVRAEMLEALVSAYPEDAGHALSWREALLHKAVLFVTIVADCWIARLVCHDLLMGHFRLSLVGAAAALTLFTAVVTVSVYLLKVKLPQYVYR